MVHSATSSCCYCCCCYYNWLLPLTLRVQCKTRWADPVRIYKQWLTLSLSGVQCWNPEAKCNFNRGRISTNANKNASAQPQGALTTMCMLCLNNKFSIRLLQPHLTTTFFPKPRNPSTSQASSRYPRPRPRRRKNEQEWWKRKRTPQRW